MARKQTASLLYYGVRTDFEFDYRFLLAEEIMRRRGASDYMLLSLTKVVHRLLSRIYTNGYYANYGVEVCLYAAQGMAQYGIYSEHIESIVQALIECKFFNEEMLTKHGILTSYEIQDVWRKAMAAMRRKGRIEDKYKISIKEESKSFISSEEMPSNADNFGGNDAKQGISSEKVSHILHSSTLSQSVQSVSMISQSEATDAENKSGTAEPPAPGPEETPLLAAPPPLQNIDMELVRSPEECGSLYLDDVFQNSHQRIMARFNLSDATHFRKWVGYFIAWLGEGKLDKHKSMNDFVEHLIKWLKTYPDLSRDPDLIFKSDTTIVTTPKTKNYGKPSNLTGTDKRMRTGF